MTPGGLASQFDLYADHTPLPDKAQAYRHAAKMVREFLVPKWSKTRPTEPGLYWIRGQPNREEEVVLVRYVYPATNHNNPADLCAFLVNHVGQPVPIRWDEPHIECKGPISGPEDPTP